MSGGGGAKQAAQRAEEREIQRENRIREGMSRIDKAFQGFDDRFFDAQRQAYLDYAVPNIRDQFERAQAQLMYALARGGQLDSEVATRRNAELIGEHQRELARADSLADQAVKQARADVERERADLVSLLQATADPEAAANQARLRSDTLRIRQPMAEVGPLFQNATAGLAAALAPTYDAYGRRVGGGVSFGGQRGSGRVVR